VQIFLLDSSLPPSENVTFDFLYYTGTIKEQGHVTAVVYLLSNREQTKIVNFLVFLSEEEGV
jgi:hypothetical protein